MDVGFLAITGVVGAEAVCVCVGPVSNWVSPGMSADSLFIPRPLPELEVPPLLDEPGTATAETGVEVDEEEVVGLETAPANEKDVVGAVVVIDVVFAGAVAGAGAEVVEPTAAESLL